MKRNLSPLPSATSSASVWAELSDESKARTVTLEPSDSTAICGEPRTPDAFITHAKSSADRVNDTSGDGMANCFSGGVLIIDGSQKRYLILLRPLLPTILTSFSLNSKVGLSLCKETTDRNLFKS